MSRIWVFLTLVTVSLSGMVAWAQEAPPPTQAATTNKDEIAYRAALGRAEDIKLLLNSGANPNGTNKEGIPLLIVAASRKDPEALGAVQALLEGGANVNVKDGKGQTALYYAARTGKIGVVDYLLKNDIDYYSLDNNGDIARTIAFRSGHKNIVQMMDDYVKSQTIISQNTYQNAQQLLQDQRKKAEEEAIKQAKIAKQQNIQTQAKMRAEHQRKLEEYRANLQKLESKIYDISYNSCAFQYWSFALSANQTMAIPDDQVEETIIMHRENVQSTALAVMKMFNVGRPYVNQVILPSKQAIYDQLRLMPSRTYRKEHGVGTMEDVFKRCDRIAKNWEISMPSKASLPKNPGQNDKQRALQQRIKNQQNQTRKKQQPQVYPGRQIIQKTGPAAVNTATQRP